MQVTQTLPIAYPQVQLHSLLWHPLRPQLLAITTQENAILLTIYDQGWTAEQATSMLVELPQLAEAGQWITAQHHPDEPLLLFVFSHALYLWDYQDRACSTYRLLTRPVFFDGGFFPDGPRVWTLPVAGSESVDLAIWDYKADTYETFALDHSHEYSRGATMHPSGRLVGALWSGDECGYKLHRLAEGESGQLAVYAKGEVALSEYENYQPAFSADGKLFAFIANPYLGGQENKGNIYVFDAQTGELITRYNSESSDLNEKGLQFGAGASLLVHAVKNKLYISSVASERSAPWARSIYRFRGHVQHLAVHPILQLIAVAENKKLSVLSDAGAVQEPPHDASDADVRMAQQLLQKAREAAERILSNDADFVAVANGEDAE